MKKSFKKFNAASIVAVFLVVALVQVQISYSADLPETELVKTFLRDVALLDIEKYEITLIKVHGETWMGESWAYRLTSAESTMEMSCKIRNDTLVSVWLNPISGSLLFVQSATDTLDAAKNFMDRYRAFSQKTYLQPLQNMLNQVTIIEPMTVTSGNTTFTVEPNPVRDYVFFEWRNDVNGIYNGVNGVNFYLRDGNFKEFVDTWNRYPIGSADAMSEEEAYSLAKAAVEAYSYKLSDDVTVSGLVVSDKYAPPVAELTMLTRGEALYPSWEFLVPLNQTYPYRVSSVYVRLWADTGEIGFITTGGTMGGPDPSPGSSPGTSTPPPSESPPPGSSDTMPTEVILFASPFVATIVIAVAALALKKRRK